MPTINPSLVPTVAPGNLFDSLTTDTTINVRWLTSLDPAHFEAINRPIVDTVLRQLILAKAMDTISLNIGHQSIFPFLIQAQIEDATESADVPNGWIWDLHISAPKKWENFRLAKIKRMSGANTTDGFTGTLRLIFTANQEGSLVESAVFTADYQINSVLTYQRSRITISTTAEEAISIDASETDTVDGFITFRTLPSDAISDAFFDLLDPPTDTTDADTDGFFDTPSEYEIVDTVAGGTAILNDFSGTSISHGTGMLVDSTYNAIPDQDSDIQAWVNASNYPFDVTANRTSTGNAALQMPVGMFREFNIAAPAGDEPEGDTTGLFFPVWINRIEAVGTDNTKMNFYFATHNVTDDGPTMDEQEFAVMQLDSDWVPGRVVAITPTNDLRLVTGTATLDQQHFGRGHVVLSTIWSDTADTVGTFFDAFAALGVDDLEYTQSSTRISSFGISRVPKYVPTIGESQALAGTTSDLDAAVAPSSTNKYITEQDQGLGDAVDLEAQTGIDPYNGIEKTGYTGALAHRVIKLCLDYTKIDAAATTSPTFYDDELLPRFRVLLGRDPAFGDVWYDGTRFKWHNGNTWQD